MAQILPNQIENYLMKCIKNALDEVGEKVNELLREHVDDDVYKVGYKANYYAYGDSQPTFDLRESVTTSDVKTNGNQSEVSIFHDKNKMRFEPDNFIHGSRYWKDGTTDIREYLPMIVDMGLSGDLFGSGWWQDERPYFRNTLAELRDNGKLKQWFKEFHGHDFPSLMDFIDNIEVREE
jgi:hypothetical protein